MNLLKYLCPWKTSSNQHLRLYARCRPARQPIDQPAPSNNGHPFLDAGVRSLHARAVSLLPGTGGSLTHVPISRSCAQPHHFPARLGYLRIAPSSTRRILRTHGLVAPEPSIISVSCLRQRPWGTSHCHSPVQTVSSTKPLRLLRHRPRFAVPGTPVTARLSSCAVVFATHVAFLPVARCISGWRRIGR